MTDNAELRLLAEAAGPWGWLRSHVNAVVEHSTHEQIELYLDYADARFVAAVSPDVILQLLSELADLMDAGAGLIAAERRRQLEAEGWTPEHDEDHDLGELLAASDEYVRAALRLLNGEPEPDRQPIGWPWEPDAWKPSEDPVRNLVKAGALIAAEIDRIRRARAEREAGDA